MSKRADPGSIDWTALEHATAVARRPDSLRLAVLAAWVVPLQLLLVPLTLPLELLTLGTLIEPVGYQVWLGLTASFALYGIAVGGAALLRTRRPATIAVLLVLLGETSLTIGTFAWLESA